jgi:predicted acylesterase/phospholipase RssA
MRRNSHGGIDSGFTTHTLMRIPSLLLMVAGLVVSIFAYFTLRVLIDMLSRMLRSSKEAHLTRNLHASRSYDEWRMNAERMNKLSSGHSWRSMFLSCDSFKKDLEEAISHLRQARKSGDCIQISRNLVRYLNSPVTSRAFRMRYHRKSWIGSKKSIEAYISELVDSITVLTGMIPNDPESAVVAREILYSNSFGKSALCLSGGGTIGLQHIGVLKALAEQNVVPRILSGTSAGSIVAAAYCVRTAEEVERDFEPPLMFSRYQALWNSWPDRLHRLVTKGYMFDQDHWRTALGEFTLGDTTFVEAYTRTGKVLNISTTARNTNINFNYLTSPNVVISSACIASCAMPTFFGTPVIYEKESGTGNLKAVQMESYADGSLAGDVPAVELGCLFGVRFVVTSQVNPHITPFLFFKHGEPGNPVCLPNTHRGGLILSALEGLLKRQMQGILRMIRQSELELTNTFKISDVYLQNFHGNVTLWNTNAYFRKAVGCLDKLKSETEYNWWIEEGQRMTWPKIRYIQSRMLIEQALFELERAMQIKPHEHESRSDLYTSL